MNFKPYPKTKDTPSRKVRKSSRLSVFAFNKSMKKLMKKAARLARRVVE